MKIFLDTAEIEEIRTAARWGVLDGVTTNPSLYAKVGGSYDEILQRDLQDHARARSRPRSSPTTSTGCSARVATSPSSPRNIVVKVAMSENGPGGDQPLRRRGHQDQLHPDLQREPGPPRREGRRVSLLSPVRRPARRHQRGRHDRHPRARRDRHASTRSTRRSWPPRSAIRCHVTAGRPRRLPHRDAAVQGPPADGPPPAHRQGHRPVQGATGRRPAPRSPPTPRAEPPAATPTPRTPRPRLHGNDRRWSRGDLFGQFRPDLASVAPGCGSLDRTIVRVHVQHHRGPSSDVE